MLPRTHEAILSLAIAESARTGGGWTALDRPALVDGHRREDDHVFLGVHVRAPGLTHTYRPGRRFGELFAPSAKDKMLRLLRSASKARSRGVAARFVGRACHLLGDMAVPARTRGVWHLAGDPLEAWLEDRSESLDAIAHEPESLALSDPGAIADALARASSALEADTTRTPWGRALFERLGRGVRLDDGVIASQARTLVPLAIASTAALLRAVPPPSARRA